MTDPTRVTTADALTMTLYLAHTHTGEEADRANDLAEKIAATMEPEQVEECKARAAAQAGIA